MEADFIRHLRKLTPAKNRPLTTLAFAQSLDGCLTRTAGTPTRLSGEETLTLTHSLRAAHDAILVGVGTVLADNPRLSVRRVAGENPRPIIMDSQLRTPLDARFIQSHPNPWIATSTRACQDKACAFKNKGIRILRLDTLPNGWVDPNALTQLLRAERVRTLMVEGGAHILTSFLQHRLADYLVATLSMSLLGGLHSLLSLPAGDQPPSLTDWKSQRIGEDLVVGGFLKWD